LKRSLNERSRRLWAAAEARSMGRGGLAAVMAATGMSSATVSKGLRQLQAEAAGEATLPPDQVRRAGGERQVHTGPAARLLEGPGGIGGADGERRSGASIAVDPREPVPSGCGTAQARF
jgi:hypothetical protein